MYRSIIIEEESLETLLVWFAFVVFAIVIVSVGGRMCLFGVEAIGRGDVVSVPIKFGRFGY